MNIAALALLIPLLALAIPIIAIMMNSYERIHAQRIRQLTAGNPAEMEELKKRMLEMEQRLLTLQEIVISTDYDARRKIEVAVSHPSFPQAAVNAPPQQTTQG